MPNNTKSSRTSIYQNQSVRIRAIFDEAKSLRKIFCVAMDFAKAKHVALICDGKGDILKKSFPVDNTSDGVEFLCEQIESSARRRKIPRKHIFIGGEDEASYVENFTAALQARGYLVVRVNARLAKENRENVLASTDDLDLLGIAKTMLSRRARVARDPKEREPKIYREIRDLCRTRRKLVREQTASSNRIHAHVDRLFPGFLDASKSGITAFGPASLELMSKRFSAPQIAKRKHATLVKTLRKLQVHYPEDTASQLTTLARSSLAPDPQRINSQQRTLAATVELYRCYIRTAKELRSEAAELLASTPYAMLTTLPGISFVLGAGIAGELGDPEKMATLNSLCSYAGIVPATYQSGGPDSPPTTTYVSARCNHTLKDWVAQSSQKLRQYGPEEWKERHARWEVNGQHALFAGARRYLRLMRTLVRNQIPYMSPESRMRDASREIRALDAERTWKLLVKKWRTIPNWQEVVFSDDKPLGFWRRVAIEMHGANLPFPKER